MKFAFAAGDDYGVVGARAPSCVRMARNGKPLIVDLPLPKLGEKRCRKPASPT